ncbi:hypothetical protein [Reichenbachiella ulvae]|uniref:Uncharacterized protein n=1 Tax=Reichenbachiella ulvae TaxID=2980104 RepID=A0ABT3CR08_9BACT|nr:hypothetical protein [Reichenbachiella ulvae]MCV9386120.1 hypothetical protein [Reichenbachiella ulvae]
MIHLSVLSRSYYFLIYLVLLSILSFSVFLGLSDWLFSEPNLAWGIIADLTLTAPLVYLIMIWKTKIPKLSVVPVLGLGILIGTYIIPASHQLPLTIFKSYVLPLVELSVLFLVGRKVIHATSAIRKAKRSADVYGVIKEQCALMIENIKVSRIFATEMAMIYYGLFAWRKAKPGVNEFTSYKESGVVALLIAVVLVVLIETVGLHFLLIRWNESVAWIIFGVSLYTAIQVLAHQKALKRRFIQVSESQLELKNGLFGDLVVNWDEVESIEAFTRDIEEEGVEQLAFLKGLESYNLLIRFKNEVTIEKLYGMKKKCNSLLVQVDDRERFLNLVSERV